MLYALIRGGGRFLFWSTVGIVMSRITCELLLVAYVIRDAITQKLRLADSTPSPLVKAPEGGGYPMTSGCSSSGYQTVQ